MSRADFAGARGAAQRKVQPEDICFILYTSGSTAALKGLTLAHGPLIANAFDIGERINPIAADRVWLAVPLFWSFGSANALPALMTHRGSIVLQESFEPSEAIALIERDCTVYYGMANMARAMRGHPAHPGRRLGAIRTSLTIGPPEDIAMTIEVVGTANRNLRQLRGDRRARPARPAATQSGPAASGMTIRAVRPR